MGGIADLPGLGSASARMPERIGIGSWAALEGRFCQDVAREERLSVLLALEEAERAEPGGRARSIDDEDRTCR